jgi:hypothetical protein
MFHVQNLITQLNIIFLEKLIATYLVKNLPICYETQSFVTALKGTQH